MHDFIQPNPVQEEIARKTAAAHARADAWTAFMTQCDVQAAAIRAKENADRERDRRGRAEIVQHLSDPEFRADLVLARTKFNVPKIAPDKPLPEVICWMPIGEHQINAGTMSGGSWGGRVIVDMQSAASVIADYENFTKAGDRIFIDFGHADKEAAAWVTGFSWQPSVGIVAGVKWTSAGEEAVRGGVFVSFSPTFYICADGHVAGLVRNAAVGGLVNTPAFGAAMPSIISSQARAQAATDTRHLLIASGSKPEEADSIAASIQWGRDVQAVAKLVHQLAKLCGVPPTAQAAS